MAMLQVRKLDDRLYAALKERAAENHRSVSGEVVAVLEDYVARPRARAKMPGEVLLEFAGAWKDDRTPEKMAADIRKARHSTRRLGKGGRRVFD